MSETDNTAAGRPWRGVHIDGGNSCFGGLGDGDIYPVSFRSYFVYVN